jgi:hypothetical protein
VLTLGDVHKKPLLELARYLAAKWGLAIAWQTLHQESHGCHVPTMNPSHSKLQAEREWIFHAMDQLQEPWCKVRLVTVGLLRTWTAVAMGLVRERMKGRTKTLHMELDA